MRQELEAFSEEIWNLIDSQSDTGEPAGNRRLEPRIGRKSRIKAIKIRGFLPIRGFFAWPDLIAGLDKNNGCAGFNGFAV